MWRWVLDLAGLPCAAEIMAATHRTLQADGVDSAHVNLVWTPRWDPGLHASEDARMGWASGIVR